MGMGGTTWSRPGFCSMILPSCPGMGGSLMRCRRSLPDIGANSDILSIS
jgi:hypothetical protein